ncbi:single-stranded DNA-binding protein [Phytoactinopolyspora limicola]|uniref:single-stranded DNA-binding protein n=1 Tax=Phytoactinopolyspora limicola TaxID=2715536 RepID=UPI0014088251|nr:single-stranded DNA-binding protein [Phytoactinopolyspora limicola]
MTAATLTVTGNVASEVVREEKRDTKEPWTHFRMACNERRYDAQAGSWVDGEPSFYTVVCWQSQLAKNICLSLKKGDPVVVHGKVRVREWRDNKNVQRFSAEITASSIGHDLFRGTSTFQRNTRVSQVTPDSAEVMEKLAPYVSESDGVDQASGEVIPGDGDAVPWPSTPPEPPAARTMEVGSGPGTAVAGDESDDDDDNQDEAGNLAEVGLAA